MSLRRSYDVVVDPKLNSQKDQNFRKIPWYHFQILCFSKFPVVEHKRVEALWRTILREKIPASHKNDSLIRPGFDSAVVILYTLQVKIIQIIFLD